MLSVLWNELLPAKIEYSFGRSNDNIEMKNILFNMTLFTLKKAPYFIPLEIHPSLISIVSKSLLFIITRDRIFFKELEPTSILLRFCKFLISKSHVKLLKQDSLIIISVNLGRSR